MRLFGFEIRRERQPEQKAAQFETVLQRLLAAKSGELSFGITPDNCMAAPTVHAIVTAVANRIAVTPVHVYRKKMIRGRVAKEPLPDHPVAKLFRYPNPYQTRVNFWADAASSLLRWGNFYAYKGRGSTGPILFLQPMRAGSVEVTEQDNMELRYRYGNGADQREYTANQILHVRSASRDYLVGDSPVRDVSQAIALEIYAEQFGATFFRNGALPLLMFKYAQGSAGFKTADEEREFIKGFQEALGGERRHRAMLLPRGVETSNPVPIENDRAQFLETRKYQRTVIAGAFGVPPQYVGDLERATFNNAEQQSLQFTADVIYPVVQKFEAALERDLLTDSDWNNGVIIRFNLDSLLRADFKSRQEGLQIQHNNGVICSNEWREIEGRNPLPDDKGGEDYLMPANMKVAGEEEEPAEPEQPGTNPQNEEDERGTETDTATDQESE